MELGCEECIHVTLLNTKVRTNSSGFEDEGEKTDEEGGGVGIYQGMLIPTITMKKMSTTTSTKSDVFDFYLDVLFVAQGPLQWLTHVEH